MTDWQGLTGEIERLLRLQTYPVAYKRLDDIKELDKIPNVRRLDRTATFCQLPTLVRRSGWTIGVPRDNLIERCALMNGLQYKDYERFNFFFIGEGACADGLAQCYTTGKPALAIPCFGERRFGGVTDDEMVIALPPGMIEKAVEGLQALWNRGLRYPIMYFGTECDPSPALAKAYPQDKTISREKRKPRQK